MYGLRVAKEPFDLQCSPFSRIRAAVRRSNTPTAMLHAEFGFSKPYNHPARRFQGEGVDLLAAASRDGAVAVWRISEAEGGLRSDALLSLLLRDAAGERTLLRAHAVALRTLQGTWQGCVRACAAGEQSG